jgi:cold shock CspA family protein
MGELFTHSVSRVQKPERGKMLWFNEEKDHGFIQTDDEERLYVHGSGFEGGVRLQGPCAGMVVEFMIEDEADGRQAQRVRVVPDIAPRRARRHRSH